MLHRRCAHHQVAAVNGIEERVADDGQAQAQGDNCVWLKGDAKDVVRVEPHLSLQHAQHLLAQDVAVLRRKDDVEKELRHHAR